MSEAMSDIQHKARPILFSGPMVRAILDGRKKVTRRPVKSALVDRLDPPRGQADVEAGYPFVECEDGYVSAVKICPYGQPGDRLWVRETFNRTNPGGAEGVYYYRADGRFPAAIGGDRFSGREAWKPSIHMPRSASRILLEVTAVRVERLQDISEEQAEAEGVHRDMRMWFATDEGGPAFTWPQNAFEHLWRKINGTESWDANPWVWVVEFKRITA